MESRKLEPVLGHPSRRQLYEAILDEPRGISVTDVARRTGIYWTAAAFHVERLVKAGLVRRIRSGRRLLLFPSSDVMVDHAPLGLLREPACRRVAEAIAANPHRRVWELCEILQMSERALYHHLKRLTDAALVLTTKKRGYRELEASPRLLQLLQDMREKQQDPTGGGSETTRGAR